MDGEAALQSGETCWRVENAGRAAVLLDSGAYFSAAIAALHRARHSILLLGWGFDPRTRLTPDAQGHEHGPDEIGALLARQWGDTAIADRYAANAAHLRANITGVFWDHTMGAFINGFDRTGTRDPRVSPHAQTWGILLDLVPQGKTDGLFSAVFDDPRSRPRDISMQAYYELMAYTKAGRFPKALEYLKKNWGWMLDNGFTRFIEDIRPADGPRERLMFYGRPYGLSLNHGWTGATAVSLLMRGTLGLRVVEPGYRLCELRPNWKIFDWVKVSIPTPHGSLALDYNRAKGAEIQVPGEVRIRVVGESGTVQEFAGPGRHKV